MTCDTCNRPFGKDGCYVYYSPDRKSKIHACPECWERKVNREAREEFDKNKKLNHREQVKPLREQ